MIRFIIGSLVYGLVLTGVLFSGWEFEKMIVYIGCSSGLFVCLCTFWLYKLRKRHVNRSKDSPLNTITSPLKLERDTGSLKRINPELNKILIPMPLAPELPPMEHRRGTIITLSPSTRKNSIASEIILEFE